VVVAVIPLASTEALVARVVAGAAGVTAKALMV
jgi:hypothetical protein